MSKIEAEKTCIALASTQHGCIERSQAEEAGVSKHGRYWKIKAGLWTVLRPNVYALPGSIDSWHRRMMAAALWAGPGCALSHRAAAHLWELDGFGKTPVELSSPRRLRPIDPTDRLHRVASPKQLGIRIRGGLPVTSPERTLLDLAPSLDDDRLERVLDDLLRRELIAIPRLTAILKLSKQRRGSRALRRLTRDRTRGRALTESRLEQLLYTLIKDSGLTPPERQWVVRLVSGYGVRLDLAYPEQLLAIESDGYRYHSGKQAWQRDRTRDAELTALGWRILRFTWDDVHQRPEIILDQLDRALRRSRGART